MSLLTLDPEVRNLMLLVLGALLGATLFHADFGFTGAYRRLIAHGDGATVMPQLLLVGLCTVLFAPVFAAGGLFGQGVAGATAPVSVSVVIGAFVFGIGMQLGGGCGSGTLYALGRGSLPMFVTLPAFCAGGFWASLHSWWQELPSAGEIVLGDTLGWPLAVGLQLLVLLGLAWALRRRTARARALAPPRVTHSTWPWWWGGVVLALLCVITLLLAGHPWTITWAFTLWAAKVAVALGWDPATSAFWQGDFQQQALQSSVFTDTTSLMDIGLILGTFVAAALARGLVFRLKTSPRQFLAALVGGLMMGYGARMAYGCNIGAFVSGVASTSVHGWLWIALALPGNWVGVALRRRIGLAV